MKRYNNLYEQIITLDNLRLADQKARKNKTKSYGVQKFDKNPEGNLLKLNEWLTNDTYRTSQYKIGIRFTPKERTIYQLPYFPDRIVHHAVMNVLEPIWVSVFTADSYSCIKNRGIHGAMRGIKQMLKKDPQGTKYCLKIDVRKFYESIDHDILKKIVRKKIKDNKLLHLLDEIIDSAPGVPIGNYLSQYFANLYLTYFDHWIKEVKKIKHYSRYADDMVFLAETKEELHELFHYANEYLTLELNLEIKGNWQVFPVEARGIDYVGYVFFHTHTLVRKSIKQNFCRKVARLRKRRKLVHKKEIASWIGWLKHCDAKNLIKKLNYESILRPTAPKARKRQQRIVCVPVEH